MGKGGEDRLNTEQTLYVMNPTEPALSDKFYC